MTNNRKKFEDFFLWKALIAFERNLLWVLGLGAVLIITATVIMRYILKTDLFGMEELLTLIAIWLYFIGGSYGSYENSHITADVLSAFVTDKKVMRVVHTFIAAISLAVSLFFTKWAFKYWEQVMRLGGHTPGLKYPLPLPRFALVLGFIIIDIFSLYHLVNLLIGREPIIYGKTDAAAETAESSKEE